MRPNYNSSSAHGCDEISSNCIVWQGPDISCLSICNGDTVSTVVAALGEKLCKLTTDANIDINILSQDVTTLNYDCLREQGYGNPQTLGELLQVMITALCDELQEGGNGDGSAVTDCKEVLECSIGLEACFVQVLSENQLNGDVQGGSSMTFTSWIDAVQNLFCTMVSTHGVHRIQLDDHERRIRTNERNIKSFSDKQSLPQVVPTTVGTPGRPQNVDIVLKNTESAFGELLNATGTAPQIVTGIGYQESGLNQKKTLNGDGNMNGVTGWVTNPSNLAQSFQNLWLTVNDMRNALDSLIDTTTPTTCSGIIYDVIATTVGSVGAITDINLKFNNSILPAGFNDCNPTGARIKITDDNRNSIESNVIISSFISSSTGTNVSISGLNASSSSYDVEVPFCFSNSAGSQCERIVNRIITATQPKPSISFTPGTTSITATLDASNLSSSDSVRIEMINSAGSTHFNKLYTPPSVSFTAQTIGGTLTPGSTFTINVYVLPKGVASQEYLSSTSQVTTTGITCANISVAAASFNSATNPASGSIDITRQIVPLIVSETLSSGSVTNPYFVAACAPVETSPTDTQIVSASVQFASSFVQSLSPFFIPVSGTPKVSVSPGLPVSVNDPDASLVTNSTTYTVTGTPVMNDGWRYVDRIVSPQSITRYVYADYDTDFDTAATINKVVFSCEEPFAIEQNDKFASFVEVSELNTDGTNRYTKTVNAQQNIIAAETNMSFYTYSNTSASTGTVTFTTNPRKIDTQDFTYQSGSGFKFIDTYTTTGTITRADGTTLTDTSISTLFRALPIQNVYTDIVVFIDSTSISDTEGAKIKTMFTTLEDEIEAQAPGWLGQLYVLPVATFGGAGATSTPDGYLRCLTSIATKGSAGASGGTYSQFSATTLATSGSWSSATLTPSSNSWWQSGSVSLPSNVLVFYFGGKANGTDGYGNATGAASLTANTAYKLHYTEMNDVLNGLQQSQFGVDNVTASTPKFKLDGMYVIPVIAGSHDGSDGVTKGLLKQVLMAVQADAMTATQYAALKYGTMGLSSSIITEAAMTGTNPYEGVSATTVSGSLTIEGLVNQKISTIPFVDGHFPLDKEITRKVLQKSIALYNPTYTLPTQQTASRMGSSTFGSGASSSAACSAKGSGSTIIFNGSGTLFDANFRAYGDNSASTAQTAYENQDWRYELVDGQYYADSVSSTVAQYKRTYPHWINSASC